jgi:hypothetical protein
MNKTQPHGTTGRPSLASVLTMYALALAALGATVWTATGETFDGRHLVGFLLGLLCAGVLFVQAGARIGGRVNWAREQRRREREAQDERVRHTGTWLNPETREVMLRVRYEPQTGRYLALGWIAAGWEAVGEFPFASARYAFVALVEAERDGMIPANDDATRMVRARLCLPGWDVADLDAYVPV